MFSVPFLFVFLYDLLGPLVVGNFVFRIGKFGFWLDSFVSWELVCWKLPPVRGGMVGRKTSDSVLGKHGVNSWKAQIHWWKAATPCLESTGLMVGTHEPMVGKDGGDGWKARIHRWKADIP